MHKLFGPLLYLASKDGIVVLYWIMFTNYTTEQ